MGTYLEDTELAQYNIALAHDIMNAAERLFPIIDKTKDPVEMDNLLTILKAANKIKLLNRKYNQASQSDHLDNELKKIIEKVDDE